MKKKTYTKSLIILLTCCMTTLLLTVMASAADTVASGTCGAEGDGSNLTWTLDSDGLLIISGSGAMTNTYLAPTRVPWFDRKTDIKMVKICDGATNLAGGSFSGCTELISVELPESLTRVGDDAFWSCGALVNVEIPNNVTSIGNGAFSDCTSLTSITLPDSVTSIGGYAFGDCNSLTNVYISDMNAWCRITFDGVGATPMCQAENIYLNGEKIVSVEVPQDVTALNYTFYGFKELVRVVLPNTLTSVGSCAFSGCTSLMSVVIPDGVTSIGNDAFSDCTSLTNITIPDSVTSIGNNAFGGCTSLMSITLPDSLTSIGEYTFYDCTSLMSITIPSGVTSIGRYAFRSCTSLTSITIPDGVTSIGSSAFSGCTSLTSITLPNSVTSIGADAFGTYRWQCNLTSVYITDVAAWCRISFGDNTANPLYYAKNLYVNGTKAETLEIPEGVQVISTYAFINAECIERVALPKSLVGVAANAFSGCTGVKEVYYAGSESEWDALAISTGNESLKNAQIYYGSTLDNYFCRIGVKVSDGGRIYVDRSAAQKDDIVTVTAKPYAGYELTAIYVDGEVIEGNTFAVTGNHEVSAAFTKLPVYGGTEEYRIEGVTVQTAAGEKLQELVHEKLLVSVSVRHIGGTNGTTIMLAQYDADGRYQGLVWLTLDEVTDGMAMKFTLPVDNSKGEIANLKAFVVGSLLSPTPVGTAVSFGDV